MFQVLENRTSQDGSERINQELYKKNAELAFRNKTLLLLRKLYVDTLITSHLKDLAARLVDSIQHELNPAMIGIFLLSKDKKLLVPLECKFSGLLDVNQAVGEFDPCVNPIVITNENSVQQKVLTQGQMLVVDNLGALWSNPLRKQHLAILQQKFRIISTVLYPLNIDKKAIGVFLFSLDRPYGDLSSYETEALESFSSLIAIAIDKARVYEQVEITNKQLEINNQRLKQLDSAKSEFLSIASHQLRTPLTGIKGYLSMILEGDYGAITPKVKPIIEEVFQNTDRLTRLVNIFLNVSRIESGRFEIDRKDVDFVELTEEVVRTLKLVAEQKKLELIFHHPDKLLPMLKLDKDKIKDVLLNLVDNAIKYTSKGKIEIFLEKFGEALKVIVKDTGIGIPKGEVRELFKKFVRGSGIAQINTGGSGLGLFIVKKIIEAHNGKVWAESAGKDMGSSFIFTLPMS